MMCLFFRPSSHCGRVDERQEHGANIRCFYGKLSYSKKLISKFLFIQVPETEAGRLMVANLAEFVHDEGLWLNIRRNRSEHYSN